MEEKKNTALIPMAYQMMAKPTGSDCNLNCSYCFYLEKSKFYGHNNRMKLELLEQYVKTYIISQQAPVINFVWQGGEPCLMGLDFYRKLISFQQKYAAGRKVENALQTNATLLDDEWCAFLRKNNFLVGVSIDGPEELHDANRKNISGAGSFKRVMRGINYLKKHSVEFNTLTTLNSTNSEHGLLIYHFLKSIGSKYLQFNSVVERIANSDHSLMLPNDDIEGTISKESVRQGQFSKCMISIFNEWVRNDVGSVFVQLFDAVLSNWVGQVPGVCIWSETCGSALAMEHNGDVYSCDHYVFPDYRLGNILEEPILSMVFSQSQKKFGADKLNALPGKCIRCTYRFACHGECPKNRFLFTDEGEPGLNYLCSDFLTFFTHAEPYMDFMAERLRLQQPPAMVMDFARMIRK